jgi:tripartite-type tricarboxylate transporter receptor subunit TctC
MMRKGTLLALAVALLALPNVAFAQSGYPDKPIKILVGFTPGVAPDITSRLLGDKFTEAWGKPVVVENITGAGGNIATDRAAKSPPDGYTLLMGGNASLVFNASLMSKLPFDPVADFAPITQIFIAANILTVPPEVPAKTIPELIAYAKANPGKLTYGHAGVGTSQHLAGELFKFTTKIDVQPVAYRGSTAIIPDLIAGRVSMCFCNVVNVMPLAREGKLRAFAVTSKKRSAAAPDLPTMIEAGFPGFEAVPWFGLMAPAGTPPDIVDKLHRETVKVLAMPDVRKKLEELGLDIVGNTPKEFAELIKTEIPQWGTIIKAAGIKVSE